MDPITQTSETPTVLVVDDDPDVVTVYEMSLPGSAEVRTAADGDAALEAIDETVDIVFLDQRMPGLSGDAVAAEIRDRHPGCMVAIVSAVGPSIDAGEPLFDMYLKKPVSREELVNAVETLQHRSSHGQQARTLCALAEKRVALQETRPKSQLRESPAFDKLATEIELCWAELDAGSFESAELRSLIA